jgi:hypothetical protein
VRLLLPRLAGYGSSLGFVSMIEAIAAAAANATPTPAAGKIAYGGRW